MLKPRPWSRNKHHYRQPIHASKTNWTHWGLNPGPSACEADVIPLHHVPILLSYPRMVIRTLAMTIASAQEEHELCALAKTTSTMKSEHKLLYVSKLALLTTASRCPPLKPRHGRFNCNLRAQLRPCPRQTQARKADLLAHRWAENWRTRTDTTCSSARI